MDTSDFFQEVAKQLEGGGQWSRLDLLEESQQAYREQPSLASFSNVSVSGEFLKRKPMQQRGRLTENVLYSTQVIPKLSEAQPKTICLDLQLNRLERTLGYRKNSSIKPHFKRQKTLLKRLPLNNKQNGDSRERFAKDNVSITSQFLQEIKRTDEELYEIYLSLYRFQEREKEENEYIVLKIRQQDKEIQQKSIELKQWKEDLSKIHAEIVQQSKNQNNAQKNILQNSLKQYLSLFQSS